MAAINFNVKDNSKTPAARWGTPEDLQGAAIFLLRKLPILLTVTFFT